MNQNYFFDENNNLILDNENNYMIGDVIVIDNKKEYEVTFIDKENNLAFAEYNGEYKNKNFSSRYGKNIVFFSFFFVFLLTFIFFLALFYKLKSRHKRKRTPKHH